MLEILALFVMQVTLDQLVLCVSPDIMPKVDFVRHAHSSVLTVCYAETVLFAPNVQQDTLLLIAVFA